LIFNDTTLRDAFLIEPEKRGDSRGWFARTWCAREFAAKGLDIQFVQQNASCTRTRGALRGMHFQRHPHAEAKLIRCTRGAVTDIIIDLRPESPTYRKWEAFELNDETDMMLLVPRGFAHGFQILSDEAEMTYLMSDYYEPSAGDGVRWNDPAFGIKWPLEPTEMSPRDQTWPDFAG
jgi:dTDP-4-dehydrorhamnose 3,5-epimerase